MKSVALSRIDSEGAVAVAGYFGPLYSALRSAGLSRCRQLTTRPAGMQIGLRRRDRSEQLCKRRSVGIKGRMNHHAAIEGPVSGFYLERHRRSGKTFTVKKIINAEGGLLC